MYSKINRSFYESISETSVIKSYIDFQYELENNDSIDHNRSVITCLKILFYSLNELSKSTIDNKITLLSILEQFLVLNASTSSKKSYHFIHANPTVLFENIETLQIFVKTIFHSLLLNVTKHICLSDKLSVDSNHDSIRDLITLLSPHINYLRVNCSQCFILNNEISIADVAYLIVYNKKKEWSLSVDLNVYSKNQQFRLFDSSKSSLDNPLTTTLDYPFEQSKSYSYFDILQKSLITNINNIHVPLLEIKDDHLFATRRLLLNHEVIRNDTKSLCNCLQEDSSRIFQYP
ncbi:unnamed protein product, partial [Rotaria sp. Silwood2]